MLNNIRIGTLDDDDTATLKSKFVDASITNLQSHAFMYLQKMHQQIDTI